MKMRYFQLNYYGGVERGFPIGAPVRSHIIEVPEIAVLRDEPSMFDGADLSKASQWARNLGYAGTFGIEELI